ncbi:hypothetical protein N9Q27_00055 [bacterium]|nr:hypothetical protein [bacterium]
MSAQHRYTKIIESLVNGDEANASELLHEAFVERAREIWSDLVEQDEIAEDEVSEEELEEAIGSEEADDFLDDIETSEDEIEAEEAFGESDDEDEDAMDMDSEEELSMDHDEAGDNDVEDAIVNVEDALADLKATFAEIIGDDMSDDSEEAEMPAMDMEADDDEVEEEFAFEAEEADEEETEELEEAADLTKIGKDGAIHPIDMPAGDDGKASPVKDAGNDMAKPVSTDTKKEAGGKAPAAKDMGVTHPGDGAKLSPETRGHGAEKKGSGE